MTYYYFCSTLPMLSFDASVPFSCQDFENDCQRHLTKRDFQDLLRALQKDLSTAENFMLSRWQEFLHCLRNETAAMRVQKKGLHPTSVIRGQRNYDSDVAKAVAEAMRAGNILEGQRSFLRAQWDYIEQLSLNTFFTKDYIFAYAIKLKILERLSAFRSDAGAQQLEDIKMQAVETVKK